MKQFKVRYAGWGRLIALFLFAFLIRLIGVDHGAVIADERINEAAKVLTGQLVPDQHFYPPLLNYITAIVYGAMFAIGKVFGVWADATAFREQYFQDPTVFSVAGRCLVAALSALSAPIAYVFARQLRYSAREALVISTLIVLAPITVYLSFMYKGDPALATFSLLTVCLMVRKIADVNSVRTDVLLAVSMALALSFKHSFALLMGPLALAYLYSVFPLLGLKGTFKSVGRIFLVGAIAWPILNIGIVLDFQNFLNFQKIQSVMSISQGPTLFQALVLLVERMLHLQSGLGIILPILFVLLPYAAPRNEYRRMLLSIWAATIVGMVFVAYLVKLRQPEHLWVSFFVIVAMFAAVTLVELARKFQSAGRAIGVATYIVALVGCFGIWQQTLAAPITSEIASVIEARFADRKIATGIPLPTVPQSKTAQEYEFARLQKTAEKYQVELPPLSQERIVPADSPNKQFILPLPNPMSGLEDTTDEDLIGIVRAYAWPPQINDWTLDRWLADGVDVFVVANLAHAMTENSSLMLRAFYRDLNDRCDVAAEFAPRKPLFLERDTVILDCAKLRE
ncbi:phospholipid carrier-dependent glycosyltransferase [Cognatishimia sp. SS12]|uniref:phospholipid carrier-dependent glycosyltransferase n=1 Tax=Cognatishimia sp. SS12 TaxID=2979465 RepID=UPI00232DA637|nr:phospholipid carrier-dependent glycosyltransferase [Cognatishimia sp. SS12]MDC0737794.1 phospholipid carrier-dependent glycosyltransferase [Cognatishimia sp. SS12]